MNLISLRYILGASLVFTLICAFFSLGFHHPDEQYYAIDFALYKLGLLGELDSWEYDTELRPWSLPLLFMPFLKLGSIFDFSPFTNATILRFLSGIWSWSVFSYFCIRIKNRFKSESIFLWFAFFLHLSFFSKFMQVRTTSENWATGLILLFYLGVIKENKSVRDLVSIGVLGALSFILRHQMGFMVFGGGMWLLMTKKVHIKKWIVFFVFPMTAIIGLSFLIDSWGYEHMSFSPWNYFYQNIYLGKVNDFSRDPVYAYLKWAIVKLGLLGLFSIIGLIYHLKNKRMSPELWMVLPFLIIHHMISHKELRFLYPVFPLTFFMAFSALDDIQTKIIWPSIKKVLIVFSSLNLVALIFICFKPAYTPVLFYKSLYDLNTKEVSYFSFTNKKPPNLELRYYLKEGTSVKMAGKDPSILKGTIFTNKYKELEYLLSKEDCELIFSTYPEWTFKFNIGNWLSRSNIWALSQCQ